MAFKIFKIEKKNADWIVASLVDAAGDVHENVSINKVSKKGDIFPNFDTLEVGTKVEARIWESDAGKKYLFAPKGGAKAPIMGQPTTGKGTFNTAASNDSEYPISEKLETILNKQVAHQIKLEQILELLQPKKKVQSTDFEANEYQGEPEF